MPRTVFFCLLLCVSALGSACDRGQEKEMPRFAARRETADDGPFRNLGKRSSSAAPKLDASSQGTGAPAPNPRVPAPM
jgi:hypothetical protein